MRNRSALVLGVVLVACGPGANVRNPARAPTRPARFIATERGPGGGVLALIAENGERLTWLTRLPADGDVARVVDVSPAWSPDGRWVVFSSTRAGSDLRQLGLWLVASAPGTAPRQLTFDPDSVDSDPAWSPDGTAVVYAARRHGRWDLWRLELSVDAAGQVGAAGEPMQLTATPELDERHPSYSPDGRHLAYQLLDPAASSSTVWRMNANGSAPRRIGSGTTDRDPVWAPDGKLIAFSAPAPGREDFDLYIMRADGTRRRHLIDEPFADEQRPRWSVTGRYLFATAWLRSRTGGEALFSSVVYADLAERPLRARVLQDPSVVARMEVAVAPVPLDSAAMAGNALYDAENISSTFARLCSDLARADRPAGCKQFLP